MSDTPRTDAAIMENYRGMLYVKPEFARNLECESDQLAKQCVKLVEEVGELRDALEAETKRRLGAEACLKSWKEDEGADAARLEWLVESCVISGKYGTREGIDAAMETQNDER